MRHPPTTRYDRFSSGRKLPDSTDSEGRKPDESRTARLTYARADHQLACTEQASTVPYFLLFIKPENKYVHVPL
jgi:hypothetical protein